MRTYNQLLKHGWNPDKILKCILAIHFLLIGAIGLDYVGFSTSILRPTIGFIYLTFIPGYLIVRIIKLQLPSNLEIFFIFSRVKSNGVNVLWVITKWYISPFWH